MTIFFNKEADKHRFDQYYQYTYYECKIPIRANYNMHFSEGQVSRIFLITIKCNIINIFHECVFFAFFGPKT